MTDHTPLTEQQLAGLLAFHAGKLATTLRLYKPNELPDHQPGIERAIGLLYLHKEQLLAGRWTDDVKRMLTAMHAAVTGEVAASLARDGFGLDEIADMLSRPAPTEGTDGYTAWMQIGTTPQGGRAELRIEGQPPLVGRYAGAGMRKHEGLTLIEPRLVFEPSADDAAEDAAEERPAEACGKCRQPFDSADTRHDGRARHGVTSFCRRCVDRCHESTDAFHECVICR
jgi:hypothetical protein